MTANETVRRAPKVHHHGGGFFSIDAYAYASSLRDWNPAVKVLFSLSALLLCIIANRLWVSVAVIVLCAVLTVCRGHLLLRRYAALMMVPGAFIVLGTIAIAVNISWAPAGDYAVSLHWFYLYVTWDGLKTAALLVLKAFGAVSALYSMTLTTPTHELLTVLRRAHCPKLIVELMYLIYRFIFILLEVQSRMRTSAQARLGFCGFKTSCLSFGSIAGNLLLLSMKKAGTYYDAMESRCYTGDLLFLEDEHKIGAEQLVWSCGGLLLLLAVWLLTVYAV